MPVDANNFIINATETGIFAFGGTNALQVNGATSGGIVMVGGTDTNLLGATLTGSTTGWNALAGSTSADTFTGGTGQFTPFVTVQGDVFGTNGGGDTVNLAAGHTLNHIDIYGTDGTPITDFGLDYTPIAASITSDTDLYAPGDPLGTPAIPTGGFGGVLTNGAPIQFGAGTGRLRHTPHRRHHRWCHSWRQLVRGRERGPGCCSWLRRRRHGRSPFLRAATPQLLGGRMGHTGRRRPR